MSVHAPAPPAAEVRAVRFSLAAADTQSREVAAQLYTTADAAVILGRAPITLRRWRMDGTGPSYILMNNRALYTRDALVAFISSHQQFRSTTEATVALVAA